MNAGATSQNGCELDWPQMSAPGWSSATLLMWRSWRRRLPRCLTLLLSSCQVLPKPGSHLGGVSLLSWLVHEEKIF